MRDALLLHQAISETAPGRDRAELLISRLVRLHWDQRLLSRVKREFRKRYRTGVREAIERGIVGEKRGTEAAAWGEFCAQLAGEDEY